jgi:hypothetical protein
LKDEADDEDELTAELGPGVALGASSAVVKDEADDEGSLQN